MDTKHKMISFNMSASEKAAYDAGCISGRMQAQSEILQYFNDSLSEDDIANSAVKLFGESVQSKHADLASELVEKLSFVCSKRSVFAKAKRAVAMAAEGAKRGWKGK